MPTPMLVITRGLPGSGKTTRARDWLAQDPEHRARVGRDTLREHVFGVLPMLTTDGERDLTTIQHNMVWDLLRAGRSVVVDDTNLPDAYVTAWENVARSAGAEFQVWDMRDVPLETCIARDAARGAAGGRFVGADTIRQIDARCGPTVPPAAPAAAPALEVPPFVIPWRAALLRMVFVIAVAWMVGLPWMLIGLLTLAATGHFTVTWLMAPVTLPAARREGLLPPTGQERSS